MPDLQYLLLDGNGDPNTSAFAAATATLYPVVYSSSSAAKALDRDNVVMPLEGLWWAEDMKSFTGACDKTQLGVSEIPGYSTARSSARDVMPSFGKVR